MSDRVELKRGLDLFMAVMIGIGAMMGPGVFALPGERLGPPGPRRAPGFAVLGLVWTSACCREGVCSS